MMTQSKILMNNFLILVKMKIVQMTHSLNKMRLKKMKTRFQNQNQVRTDKAIKISKDQNIKMRSNQNQGNKKKKNHKVNKNKSHPH